eukprot:s613_g13.t1
MVTMSLSDACRRSGKERRHMVWSSRTLPSPPVLECRVYATLFHAAVFLVAGRAKRALPRFGSGNGLKVALVFKAAGRFSTRRCATVGRARVHLATMAKKLGDLQGARQKQKWL